MRCIFDAITNGNDTKKKHYHAINHNMVSMQYIFGAIKNDTESVIVLSTITW